ncbi:signal peptidase I [Lysinibacter sp. HNR]|nr:signal peptidase I [Lysinibacter sp. HNR]WGD37208.1 signal peptidase I [Lysinibacter sp. HNR]
MNRAKPETLRGDSPLNLFDQGSGPQPGEHSETVGEHGSPPGSRNDQRQRERARRRYSFIQVIRSFILWIASIIGAICIVIFLVAVIFNFRPQAVISGSMAPFMPTGSMVFIKDTPVGELQEGDVVTVPRQDGQGLVTHRIVDITAHPEGGSSLTLRGDANDSNDPQLYRVTHAGLVVTVIPYLGVVAQSFQTPLGLVGIAVLTLAILATYTLQRKE